MKRPEPPGRISSSPKAFKGNKSHVEGFINYVKCLKEMFKETEEVEPDVLVALCRQVGKQLPEERFMNFACEQICSRNIEYILKVVKDQLVKLWSKNEEKYQPAIVGLLRFYSQIMVYMRNEGNALYLSENQYGSHTVEHVLTNVRAILQATSCGASEECKELLKSIHDIVLHLMKEVFCFKDGAFWHRLTDVRGTYLIRKLCELADLSADSKAFYVEFCRKLFDYDCVRLQEDIYTNDKGSPTLQSIIKTYVACDKQVAEKCLGDKLLPEKDETLMTMLTKSACGNHTIEFFITEKLLSQEQVNRLYQRTCSSEQYFTDKSPVRFIIKSLIVNYPCEDKKILKQLIEKIDLTKNLGITRGVIQNVKGHKSLARLLVQRVRELVSENHNLKIDWAARVEEFQKDKTLSVEQGMNFWHLLVTTPKTSDTISFNGMSVACELLECFKPGYLTTEVMHELELLLSCEETVRKIATNKKGAMMLQIIVRTNMPEELRQLVRRFVISHIQELVFNEYSSYLVSEVIKVSQGLPKELKQILTHIKPMSSEIKLRNFALYKSSIENLVERPTKTSRF